MDQSSGTSANLHDVSFASDALRGIAVGDAALFYGRQIEVALTSYQIFDGYTDGNCPTPSRNSDTYRDTATTAAYSDAQGLSHPAVSPFHCFFRATLRRQ